MNRTQVLRIGFLPFWTTIFFNRLLKFILSFSSIFVGFSKPLKTKTIKQKIISNKKGYKKILYRVILLAF
jgi:hypothetical protein